MEDEEFDDYDPNEDAIDDGDDEPGGLTDEEIFAVDGEDEAAPATEDSPDAPVVPPPQAPAAESSELARALAERNRVAAAARIRERDFEILARRHEQLVRALAEKETGEEEEPELPDPDENLAGNVVGRLERIEKGAEKDRKERAERAKAEAADAAFRAAQAAAAQTRDSLGGEVYDSALFHLGRSLYYEAKESRSDLTDDEIREGIQRGLVSRMTGWHGEKKNPGEELIKFAIIRGWDPRQFDPGTAAQASAPPGPAAKTLADTGKGRTKPGGTDPKEEIRRQRDRERNGRTISSTPGVAPRGNFNIAKHSIESDEETWDRTVRQLAGGKKPALRDLLAGKARVGS